MGFGLKKLKACFVLKKVSFDSRRAPFVGKTIVANEKAWFGDEKNTCCINQGEKNRKADTLKAV